MTCDYSTIVESTNKILSEYSYPLTLRQIYYRLVANGLIPNKRSADNSLSKWLVKARERNDVDDGLIEDRARSVITGIDGYASPDEFVDAAENWLHDFGTQYHANLWANQGVYIEVWVEKDALSRVMARAAEPFRVTVCPSRGYASYTYLKRMAVDDRYASVDKPIIILDFRDHDPSGIQMTEDLQRRLTKYSGGIDFEAMFEEVGFNAVLKDLTADVPPAIVAKAAKEQGLGSNITVRRVALTLDQVKEHGLMPNPTKSADSRSSKYVAEFGDQCWELDAIPPDELQRLVTSAIEEYGDREKWKAGLEQEQKDQAELKERFANATVEV
jgi:hypothetical protein